MTQHHDTQHRDDFMVLSMQLHKHSRVHHVMVDTAHTHDGTVLNMISIASCR
jgi:hypothetical protein